MQRQTIIVTEKRHEMTIGAVGVCSLLQAVLGNFVAWKLSVIQGKYVMLLFSFIELITCSSLYLISYYRLKR